MRIINPGRALVIKFFIYFTCFFWMPIYLSHADTVMLYREFFDTSTTTDNRHLYITKYAAYRIESGELVLSYSSEPNSVPSGIECVLPQVKRVPDERIIDISFSQAGFNMSNALFVGYAIEDTGEGLCFIPMAYGVRANSYTGERSGYLIRFLRHGDGTNEIVFYRNDRGWTKKLGNIWLDVNPVTTLKRTIIRHRRDGFHQVDAIFEGSRDSPRRFTFFDTAYPPTDAHRIIQITAKAHAYITTALTVHTDSWIVYDRLFDKMERKNELQAEYAVPHSHRNVTPFDELYGDTDLNVAIGQLKDLFSKSEYSEGKEKAERWLRIWSASPDLLDISGQIENGLENRSLAFERFNESLNIRLKQFGPSSLEVAKSYRLLANMYGQWKPQKAEELYQRALKVAAHELGQNHSLVSELNHDLANFYRDIGKFEMAAYTLGKAMNVLRAGHPRSPYLAEYLYELGWLNYYHLRDLTTAEKLFKESIDLYTRDRMPDSSVHERSLHALAEVYKAQRDYRKALPLLKQVVSIRVSVLGLRHIEVGRAKHKLAQVYFAIGEYDTLKDLYSEAIAIYKESLGEWHPELALLYADCGNFYRVTKQYEKARELYGLAYTVAQKTFGERHPELVDIVINLAMLHHILKNYHDAEYFYILVLKMIDDLGIRDNQKVSNICLNLSNLYVVLDRPLEADLYRNKSDRLKVIR